MFVYLSKKIAIPNSILLKCISWDKENGYLACGGDDGLLKIVRLDSTQNQNVLNSSNQVQQQSNLSANQTLEGHNGCVSIAVWNETSQKLTTSDQNGLIIVWVFFKGKSKVFRSIVIKFLIVKFCLLRNLARRNDK
jgi:WD repeat-containing protein 35